MVECLNGGMSEWSDSWIGELGKVNSLQFKHSNISAFKHSNIQTFKYSGITIKGSFISPMQQHIGSMLLHFPWEQFYYTKSLPQYMSF